MYACLRGWEVNYEVTQMDSLSQNIQWSTVYTSLKNAKMKTIFNVHRNLNTKWK